METLIGHSSLLSKETAKVLQKTEEIHGSVGEMQNQIAALHEVIAQKEKP